jgi:hypothetical protein
MIYDFLSDSPDYDYITSKDSMGNDMEGSGRGLILGTIPVFAWRSLGKQI